jgi:O-phosphoseryl-tRNA synthetase
MIRLPGDVDPKVAELAMRSVTGRKKKVDVRGPVFVTIRSGIVKVGV